MVWPWLPLAFGNSLGHGIALPRPGHSSVPQTCGSAPWHTSWHTSCAWNEILAEESKGQKSDILMEIPHLRSPSCLKIIYWVTESTEMWQQKTHHFPNIRNQNQTCHGEVGCDSEGRSKDKKSPHVATRENDLEATTISKLHWLHTKFGSHPPTSRPLSVDPQRPGVKPRTRMWLEAVYHGRGRHEG